MLKYQLFNANIIKIANYIQMMDFYNKHEKVSPILNYLKTNEFDLTKFNNFLSVLSKRNAICEPSKSLQYSYTVKIEIVENMIIIQEKIFDNTSVYVQEHVFYCEYLFSL
jgi:hypothetical protein